MHQTAGRRDRSKPGPRHSVAWRRHRPALSTDFATKAVPSSPAMLEIASPMSPPHRATARSACLSSDANRGRLPPHYGRTAVTAAGGSGCGRWRLGPVMGVLVRYDRSSLWTSRADATTAVSSQLMPHEIGVHAPHSADNKRSVV